MILSIDTNLEIQLRKLAFIPFLFCNHVLSDEVAHGAWTAEYQKINEVKSVWSFTYFRISESSSCGTGNDHLWRIQNVHENASLQDALEYKKSMLLSAFIAQKDVKLRCENGFITDFVIKN